MPNITIHSVLLPELETTDMALSKTDKEWIQQQIAEAHKLHGWRKWLAAFKSWSPASAVIAILIFFFTNWTGYVEFRTHTDDRLKSIESTMVVLRISQTSSDPGDKKNQVEAKKMLATARKEAIKIPPNVIQETGESFIKASEKDQAAWNTALEFVNYKSFQNVANANFESQLVGIPTLLNTKYQISVPVGFDHPSITAYGVAPLKDAAILEAIGENTNSGPQGNSFLIIDGGAMSLDGIYIKNVILRNVHVVYRGGALKTENVFFLNCTFDISPNQNGQAMAASVLKSSPTTNFSAAT